MRYIIIGSGIAGVNAAMTLLEKGKKVEIWDADLTDMPHINESHVLESYYGENLKGIIDPSSESLFELPENRSYYLKKNSRLWEFNDDENFNIITSLAKGGLANGWGANSLPFSKNDIFDWPIDFEQFNLHLKKIYKRIDITSSNDDLKLINNDYGSQKNIKLEEADLYMMGNYVKKKKYLNKKNIFFGNARLAVNTLNINGEDNDLNKCIWFPESRIYNPTYTLENCHKYSSFTYLQKRKINYFNLINDKVQSINYLNLHSNEKITEKVDAKVLLCAGAIQSGIIYKRTLLENNLSEIDSASQNSLMDTAVTKIFYILPRLLGKKYNQNNFQLNRLIAGVINSDKMWPEYLHCEILNLNDMIFHPLIETLPIGSFFSKELFFSLKNSLGVLSIFAPDKMQKTNNISIDPDNNLRAKINYIESKDKLSFISSNTLLLKKALLNLGAIPFMTKTYPPGSGIHYAGTIPMGEDKCCDGNGRLHFCKNLYVADSSAFPSLPSRPISINTAAFASYVASKA